METDDRRLLVVGASYAGVQLAASAREHGWKGPISLLGAESWMPYERPPLSKAFLSGALQPGDLELRGAAYYQRHNIDLRRSCLVQDIDHDQRVATLGSGETLRYHTLALTTGASPRPLGIAGSSLDGVSYVSTLDDALALRARLSRVRQVVIIGAGFIGLEVAATLTTLGRSVRVLEAAARVMNRVLTPSMSEFFDTLHTRHGVQIVTQASCGEILGDGGRAVGVRTKDGEVLPADLVVVGIGSLPRTELAERVGARRAAEPGGGVLVDDRMRTSVPGVLAAGDCVSFVSSYAETAAPIRLESVQNATDQGRVAGATAAGAVVEDNPAPWFWSEQYDVKLQLTGVHHQTTREVVRGDVDGKRFSVVHLDDEDRVVSVDSVNHAADHVAARRLVATRARLDPLKAGDSAIPLKSAVAPTASPARL